jgi:hypothetical protein
VIGDWLRRPHRSLVLLLGLLFGCSSDEAVPSPWSAPPPLQLDLRITVEPLEVGLLQPIRVTLDRYRRDGVEVSFVPEVDDKLFVTKESETSDERPLGDGLWQRTTLTLLPVAGPGELRIPSFRAETAAVDGQEQQIATTPERLVTVTTALGSEHGPEIEAPGDPFPTPFAGWWWVFGAAFVALVAALVLVWLSRRRALRPVVAIVVPAHVKALRELARWRKAVRATEAEIAAFYVGVSQVLRVYLEDRFGLHAPERTTEEFLRDLDGSEQLIREHRTELKGFLTQCDMVKFAKLLPSEAEHDKTYQLAESLIESTRVDRIPGSSEAGDEPADRPSTPPAGAPTQPSEVSP